MNKIHLRIRDLFFVVLVVCVILALIFTTDITLTTKLSNNPTCSDNKGSKVEVVTESSSQCSEKATRAGMNQKVISYSFYRGDLSKGEFKERYAPGLLINYQRIQEIYPGWLMRVYSNIPEDSEFFSSVSNATNIYTCDVAKLPGLGDVSNINKMVWRFLPLGDPTVAKLLVRDLDSIPMDRERIAVTEWEKSDKIFHGMRDHINHQTPILGGLWGVKSHLLCPKVRQDITTMFIKQGLVSIEDGKDQKILKKVLYYRYKKYFMFHDSYYCGYFKDSVPFPIQRKNTDFVGRYAVGTELGGNGPECPVICRPSYGKNWTYC